MSSNGCLLVSDVHLQGFGDDTNRELEASFLSLIAYCTAQNLTLLILGDLFDYWMEYPRQKYAPAFGEPILKALKHHGEQVEPVLYITGNHDNWTFGHIASPEIEVEAEHRMISFDNRQAILFHGDGLADTAWDYQRPLYHRLLRNPSFIRVYQTLSSPKFGVWIMSRFSRLTRMLNISDPEPLNNLAKKMLYQSNIDLVFCGHDHLPRLIDFEGGTYMNLGAFHLHRTVGLVRQGEPMLFQWNATQGTLTKFTG
ncbi:MAG: metallophosphoesterase [Bacteroidota bacterium]